jgi:hypothetical protein
MENCIIEGCSKQKHTRGMCKRHYDMARHRGLPDINMSLEARLWRQTEPIPFSGCYVWLGPINRKGYGFLSINGRPQFVHRETYKLYKGAIYPGLVIDHKCRVRSCWNPEHLEAVTNIENLHRGKGVLPRKRRLDL